MLGVQEQDIVSVTGARWRLRQTDERLALAIAQRHHLPEVLGHLLAARGVGLEEVEHYLSPTLRNAMPDPCHLKDMQLAAERLAAAVIAGETIAVFGDYDVDGATSTALLLRFFRQLGAKTLYHIPDRMTEGYGPNAPALLALKEKGAGVVVTVDCGTTAFDPLNEAYGAGLDVIVVDHHIGEARLPKALAVVNPNRLDEESPCRHLAAVGMCFLLAAAVTRTLREQGWFLTRNEPDLMGLLDLVALGTVCDVVPLTGLNRAYVAQGLKIMAQRRNPGLVALSDLARADALPDCYHCGFVLGPRINAGGRVGRASLGTELLSCDDAETALAIARELDGYNDERRVIEMTALEQAIEQVESQADPGPVLIVQQEGWHPGVIGIVAGRLKERYHRPVAVIALEDGIGKASCRSISGVDFGTAVTAARQAGLLLAGGGHAMAAGFTVEADKIPALHAFLCERLAAGVEVHGTERILTLERAIGIGSVTTELALALERAGPYGSGNAEPRFLLKKAWAVRAEPVKGEHIRLMLAESAPGMHRPQAVKAMAFRVEHQGLADALMGATRRPVHLACRIRLNRWMGKESADVLIEDAAVCV